MAPPDPLAGPVLPTQPAVPPLLARLRAETRAAHERVEMLPGFACLLSAELSPAAYTGALRGLHAFHAGMHASLPKALRALPCVSAGALCLDESGLAALTEDLAWFHVHPKRPMKLPRASSSGPSALGALYVMEGSALGARVIGRAVRHSLGVEPGRGGSYFCGATADAARLRWQEFCALLANTEQLLDSAGLRQVVGGALASFAALETAMAGAQAAGRQAPQRMRVAEPSRMSAAIPSLN